MDSQDKSTTIIWALAFCMICFVSFTVSTCSQQNKAKETEISKVYVEKGYVQVYDALKQCWEWKKQ